MITLDAPCKGRLMSLEKVPSEVFSKKMMGDGFAIELAGHQVVAPIDGVITGVFPTGHAVMMTTQEGIEVLIHIGIDTYEVGEGFFNLKVCEHSQVQRGDLLVEVDYDRLVGCNACLITPIVITSGQTVKLTKEGKLLELGDTCIVEIQT